MAEIKTSEQLDSLWQLPLNWNILNGSNILIAGASGLIGSALVRALISNPNKSYTVYALGRNKIKLERIFLPFDKDPHLILLEGDINNYLSYEIDFHYIIDCASNSTPYGFKHNPVETIRTNINGVDNLLSYGMRHNINRFLYVSTGEVYGEGNYEQFTEEDYGYVDNLNPRSCYPLSKRAAENLCTAYRSEYGIDIVIARPCHIYGPCFLDSDDRAYAQFLRKVSNGEDIVLNSSGLLIRSWCYVVDCVFGLIYILLKGQSGHAYNISDAPLSIKEFASKVAEIGGVKVRINVDESLPTPIISHGVLSSNKLEHLGWKPQDTFDNNIRASLEELSNM